MSPDNEQKLTRQQRRALERKEGKNSPHTVRAFDKEVVISWKRTIQQEANRRKIEHDEDEVTLWEPSFTPQSSSLPESDRALIKLEDQGNRIAKSKNPIFLSALSKYVRIQGGENFRMFLSPERGAGVMAAQAGKTKDESDFSLQFITYVASINSSSHPLFLALAFTHEVEHLREIEEFDGTVSHLPLDERLSRHRDRGQDPETYRAMEARANAVEAEALIQHIGLVGIRPYTPLSLVRMASMYVEAGCDPTSQNWLEATARLETEGFVSVARNPHRL